MDRVKGRYQMRLNKLQVEAIRAGAKGHFGPATRVWLFGSRVNEQLAGGDIDLYIEPEIQEPAELVEAKLRFLLELHKQLGEQQIDVVIHRVACKKQLPIYQVAKDSGVRLL
jgi:predicted nucleotidyltransferase